jgi:outer-membrane receptor for ferric coprogen and ferric-rhodotorulic acid
VLVPAYDLHVGADVRWQDSIYYVDSGVTTVDGAYGMIRQPDYATVGLLANARIADHLHAYLNVNNIADRKYLASLEWGQAYYAAPRNASLSVVYKF